MQYPMVAFILLAIAQSVASARGKKCTDKNGVVHPSDDFWPGKANTCCFCAAGKIVCASAVCPPITCTNPKVVPGLCCKECPEVECKDSTTYTYRDDSCTDMPKRKAVKCCKKNARGKGKGRCRENCCNRCTKLGYPPE